MIGIRYIGSKARVVEPISRLLGLAPRTGVFLDVFAGTGVVSRQALLRGWPVHANDHLLAAQLMTTSQLLSVPEVPFTKFGGYQSVIDELNRQPQREGFVFREYSPSGLSRSGHVRRYFTEENAMRIDAIRLAIEEYYHDRVISDVERSLLIADLIESANAVANTAGTYGCFLRHWLPTSRRPLRLAQRNLLPRPGRFKVTGLEADSLTCEPGDVVYIDPPYTKRQYAAYYHILETIAVGDEPLVGGVTGLRPWEHKASDFCHRRKALLALVRLTGQLRSRRVLISYNSQGHIKLDSLVYALTAFGRVVTHEVGKIGRYRPSSTASSNGSSVVEYVIEVRKPARLSVQLKLPVP